MSQVVYGFPFPLPPDIDYYELNNEDVGFNANLVSTTNESHSFYLPLPGSIDLLTQTIVVHALEFFQQEQHYSRDDESARLIAMLSTRGEVPALTDTIAAADAKDASHKAWFMRNIGFGIKKFHATDASLAAPWEWDTDIIEDALVFPPVPLDQASRPLHIHLFRQNATVDPATGDETPVNYTQFEAFEMVVWFTVRNLTAAEMDRNARNASDRFAIRDA